VLAPPGRPLALVMTGHSAPSSRIFLGMDTQGLYTSMDGGRTWQAAGGGLSALGAGSLAITALAVSLGAEQVVYAAATFSMATPQGLHTRQLAFISVDDGRHWFEMRLAPRVDQAIAQLTPIAGSLLAVSMPSADGTQLVGLDVGRDFATGLDDPDPGLRAATARALGFAGERAVLPALISHLADPDLLAGDQVAQAIGRLGDAASVSLLLPALSDTDEVIRARAATAVGLLHAEEAIPQLSTMLRADGPWASRHAAEALAAIGTPAAMAALMAPLADSQMTAARHTVMRVLETTGQPAAAAVLAALHDPSAVVRANAAEMLGWLKPTHAVADLARLLSDPEPAVQAQAAWALGEIDTPAARLALVPAPMPSANPAPILAPPAVGPIAAASLAVLPVAVADIWTDYWPLAALASLFVFALFAGVLLWKGPRPTAHLGHT
jgi:hypothetical protein